MKFIGHTMAVPGMDIAQAIKLFAGLGLDGIEIVAQGGTPFNINLQDGEINRIIEASKEYNLPIVTLTPYFWDIDSADESVFNENVCGLIKAVELANKMGAKFVRSYGGRDTAEGTYDEKLSRSVKALKTAGAAAEKYGITIIVENHPGTITRTGEATRRLIDAVGMDNVRALYDPCNVLNDTNEDWLTTYSVQEGTVGYVHCKDYLIKDGKRFACVVGEGVVPWLEIMRKLSNYCEKNNVEYNISFEYEKRWYPDQIEDAATGLPRCMEYIRSALK